MNHTAAILTYGQRAGQTLAEKECTPIGIGVPVPKVWCMVGSMRSFASDNNAGVCSEVLQALADVNKDHVVAYGDDPHTKRVEELFKKIFGNNAETFFVFNGTAANVLSMKAMCQSFEAVICADTAHMNTDECGAPENITGSKLLPLATKDGKLTPELVATRLGGRGDQHHVQPKVVSITQSSEMGTVYSLEEIRALSKLAKKENLLFHIDGARLSNAAASLNCTFKEMTTDCGVDVLSFGGTKIGLMGAEAVVILNPALAKNFKYLRKQNMQLSSKSRFVAAQFEALLKNDLWKKNANHANKMAQILAEGVSKIPALEVTQKVQANGVFVKVPPQIIEPLQKEFFFYVWNEEDSVVRWMTSFDTQEEDIRKFLAVVKDKVKSL